MGDIDPETLPKPDSQDEQAVEREGPRPLDSLLNLDEIEAAATKQINHKTWAYYYSASDDLITKSFNNEVYRSILLRPRVFVDCTRCDLSTTALGYKLNLPIYVSPAAMARLAHPDGEAGIAAACSKFGAMQIISHNASMTPEQIVANATPDQVFGWQLYVQTDARKSEAMLARINKLEAIKYVCLTLDAPVPGKREDDERSKNVSASLPVSTSIKASGGGDPPNGKGGIGQQLFWGTDASLTWKTTLPWLAEHTDLPIVLKGIQTHEDAYLASIHAPQVKGIILSNHGGRALDTAEPAVHTLLEIRKYCPSVFNRLDVWVDGGIKRGTDVVKALALGARGVGIGRPALFGLGAGGTEGVERVLQSMIFFFPFLFTSYQRWLTLTTLVCATVLADETATAMRLLGVEKVEELSMRHVSAFYLYLLAHGSVHITDLSAAQINTRAVEQQIYDGTAGLDDLHATMKSKL